VPASPGRVTILGAGPAGLGAAYALSRKGFEVTVLERNERLGGNAGSFRLAGIPVDFGSHRFHPAADPEILSIVRDLLGDDLLERPRHGRIRLMGRWLHFPLQSKNLILNAPPRFSLGVLRDLATGPFRKPRTGAATFASELRRGLGPTICERFYFPYARKIWGLEPDAISPLQAEKRVSSNSIGKLLKKVLPGAAARGESARKGIFYYPRNGFGQISEAFHDAAVRHGARVLTAAQVTGVAHGDTPIRVEFTVDDDSCEIEADHVWSTIPVTALARMASPSAPAEVLDAARRLRYRGMLLIYLVLETPQFTPFDAHYLPGEDVRITRLSEPRNYSDFKKAKGRTVLCAELPCQPGDATWSLSDPDLGALVIEDLQRSGLPVECTVSKVHVARLPQAYPLYPVGFETHFDLLDDWVENQDRLLSFGRQGLYAHDNTHHALYMAFAAARCLSAEGHFDRDAWAREREVFSTHVVED
jgi:protoporphyrinogen oxidase